MPCQGSESRKRCRIKAIKELNAEKDVRKILSDRAETPRLLPGVYNGFQLSRRVLSLRHLKTPLKASFSSPAALTRREVRRLILLPCCFQLFRRLKSADL